MPLIKIYYDNTSVKKGVKGAWEWDKKMSQARKNLDWEEQVRLSLDPARAQRVHGQHATAGVACSMCGDFCAMQLVASFLGSTPLESLYQRSANLSRKGETK